MRTAVVGLLTMTAGCLLFIPAASSSLFAAFLLALFVLAAGITDRAGGGQSADLDAGRAADGAQPPDLRPGLQLARHHRLPLCRARS
jgi:hypothetical protein